MRLKEAAGWNQTEDDWRIFLAANAEGCFVAELGGRVVGTVTTIRYRPGLAWISMVLVHPEYRRRGIGTRLVRAALEHLRDCPSVGLDATDAGRGLYERLGFREEWGFARFSCGRAPAAGLPRGEVEPLAEEDLEQAVALDRKAFGAERTVLLGALRRRCARLAWKCVRGGRLAGFCLGRQGARAWQIGPVVAMAREDAVLLASTALRALAGERLVMDVPDAQDDFLRWLRSLGFEPQRAFTRMRLASQSCQERPRMQFAVAGPEFG